MLSTLLKGQVGILIVAETKIDESFTSNQIFTRQLQKTLSL